MAFEITDATADFADLFRGLARRLRGKDPMKHTIYPLNQGPNPEFIAMLDPEVRTNMLRFEMALRKLLTGRWRDHPSLKVKIGTGFTMSDKTDDEYQEATRRDGYDRLYIRFDVDDPLGSPDGLGLVRSEDGRSVLYGRCRLWMPRTNKNPVIAYVHEDRAGHFSYAPNKTLNRTEEPPAKVHAPGFARADRHLASLVKSKHVRKIKVSRFIANSPSTSDR